MVPRTPAALTLFLAAAIGPRGASSFVAPSSSSSRASPSLFAKKKVFIDGEAGTTGLQVRDRLAAREDLEIVSISDELRKDVGERKRLINEADCVILCLPDEASKEVRRLQTACPAAGMNLIAPVLTLTSKRLFEMSLTQYIRLTPIDATLPAQAAAMVENERTVVIDASTAFRVDDDWTYGFPELSKSQKESIKHSKRISNPGCYPTGFVALVRPLVDAGIVPPDAPLTVNAVSGYSGGGKGLIEVYEGEDHEPWGAYGYSMVSFKCAKECGLFVFCERLEVDVASRADSARRTTVLEPAFVTSAFSRNGRAGRASASDSFFGRVKGNLMAPRLLDAVATFAQGMVVSVPLHYSLLKKGTTGKDVHAALTEWYEGSSFVKVMPLGESGAKEAGLLERGAFLRPDSLADTNNLELFVFSNDEEERMVLCARLDNLGKGASGAAVQNLNLSLGLDESSGL
ncbi:hypothetical protein ACHAWF_010995 [Thalassiosira exigua]